LCVREILHGALEVVFLGLFRIFFDGEALLIVQSNEILSISKQVVMAR
jgi:hypothetical protein